MRGPLPAEPLALRRDARGVVFEPIDAETLSMQRNCHVVLTAAGQVRGNHYHTRATERLIVLGPALARFRIEGRVVEARVPEGEAWRFTIPPGVAHAIRGTGEGPNVIVAFATEPFEPGDPDTVRDVLL